MRAAGRITALTGAVTILLGWVLGVAGIGATYEPIVTVLAELLLPVSLILAFRFRRSRIAIAAITLALANYLLRRPGGLAGGADPASALLAFDILAILVPLNLGILALLRERPLSRPTTLVHIGLVLLQPILVSGLLAQLPAATEPTAQPPIVELLKTPQTLLLTYLLVGVVSVLALVLRREAFEGSLIWVLVATALVGIGALDPARASLMLAAAQLTLLVGLVEDSYRLAFHDELTGLPSRRALEESMRSLRGEYALGMVDVDNFKRFNDRYGHDAGDQALRMVAAELARVSHGGRAFRYGGEEFTVVFTGRSVDRAADALEQVRAAIESKRFAIRAPDRPRRRPREPEKSKKAAAATTNKLVALTVSMGVATPSSRRPTPADVLKAADQALYKAKRSGRNRLITA